MAVGNKFAESQGLSYVPNDMYLQEGFTGSEPLDFSNISSSGIMTQAPIIYPPVNQGGGGGPIDPGPTDYGYNSIADNPNATPVDQPQTNFEYDIEEGTIDEEDIKNNRPGFFSTVGKIGSLLSNPLGTMAYGAYRNYAQKKENEQKRQEAQQLQDQLAVADREIAANNYRNYGSGEASQETMDSYGVDKDTGNPGNYDQDYDMKDGGRAGYFFGGRVNYKAGGRTDAGPNRTTASHSTRGQINESGQQVSGGQTTRDNNDGGNSPFYGPKPTFFNNPEILNKETILGDIPTGIGFNNSYGRYKATMDLKESLKEKGLKGELEYNNNINNFDLAAKYSSQDGPTYGVGYTGNNFDVNVNNQTGANASYSKDIGPGTFTMAGTYNPDGTYNTEARYGISFGQGKKNGGRIGFKNGGLASIL